MLNFLMKKKERLISGAELVSYYCINGSDFSNPANELEKALTAGGFSESEYEVHELIGVEILDAEDRNG